MDDQSHDRFGPPPSIAAPVILFDGVCGLCNRWVDFVLERDRGGIFRFATLQSSWAQRTLERHGLPGDYLATIVLIEGDRLTLGSVAALRILRRLGAPWRWAYALIVVPPIIRDGVYDLIAARRYRWFGKRDTCRVPTPEIRARFIA